MRAYTVQELDALREVVKCRLLFGWYQLPRLKTTWVSHRSYGEGEKVKAVEEMVRTHMLAGHTADDLIKSEDEARAMAEAEAASDNG